jgi:ferredoxin-NADP reductase/predicted pyridoxine 5'-phosphate oxidase superfamily flavin-nucleotide-binding protein
MKQPLLLRKLLLPIKMAPLSTIHTTHSTLYPSNWPSMPFHEGEVAVQKLLGSHEHVMTYAPKFIRPFMPEQHRDFFEAQPFVVVAARDTQGCMWSTLLASGKNRIMTSPDPKTLLLDNNAKPVAGDALEGALVPGIDLGMIAIEFATKRRNRVNGRLIESSPHNSSILHFQVDQCFGNCPQYIKPRQWWIPRENAEAVVKEANNQREHLNGSCYPEPSSSLTLSSSTLRTKHLSESQITFIKQAETIFLATGYRGVGDDPRYGNDASHRGGPPGFVLVGDSKTLILPDFAGNNHYNTIGNLQMDPRIGITFPDYETGAMVQVTGTAIVNFDKRQAAESFPGAQRLIEISIDEVVQVPEGSIPIRWTSEAAELQKRKLVVSAKIQESKDVMSFYLQPKEKDLQTLWPFQPGQHLPISLPVDPLNKDSMVERTYSISAGPNWGEYRITVKRQGIASNYLHDHIQVGDTITVHKPAGDFVLPEDDSNNHRPIVFLSNGIGVTPLISMLHHFVNSSSGNKRAYWVHGARDGQHHAFQREVEELQKVLAGSSSLVSHVAYSQPSREDGVQYDSQGRLSVELLSSMIPNIESAEFYICGSDAFVAEMEEGLRHQLGVPDAQIHYETF